MTILQTQITAVAVYPDRARVTRLGQAAGEATLPAGVHKVEVAGLPPALLLDSVRASARSMGQARLLGLQVQPAFYTETPAEQVRHLEEQIEALQDDLAALEARKNLASQRREALNTMLLQSEIYATAMAAGEMNVEGQASLFGGLTAQIEKTNAEIQGYDRTRRELDRRMAKLKNELSQLQSARPARRFSAFVEIEVLEPGDVDLELVYMVQSASWKPLYDARLLENEASPVLEISYLAEVTQQTGEAWDNVELTLSTARPALAGRIPELEPWYIHPQPQPPPMPAPMMAAAGAGPEPLVERSVRPAAKLKEMQYVQPVTASVEQTGAAVTYRLPARAGIPSDGSPHKVTVARFPLKPVLDYVSAPKLVQSAYRRAKVTNDSPYLLLPGQANLFSGDEFLGATRIELVAPQGELEFYLGMDDRVKIERELKRRDVDKSFVGGKRRIHFAYEIAIENFLASPAKLILHDHLPVGRHEDIKVKAETMEPRPVEHTELNLLKWELTLAPREKRVVRYEFTIEVPQNMPVVGLP